jgi:uncharacterized protein with GYD domain
MAHYLLRYRLTPEAWTALVQSPQDLREEARQIVESSGDIRLHDFWYAFAEHDCYIVLESDRNIEVAVVATALTAGGGLRLLATTTLFTVEEMWELLYRARAFLSDASGEPGDDT